MSDFFGVSDFLSGFGSGVKYVGDVISYIFSIFKTLWFGLTSLLSGTRNAAVQIFDSGMFESVADTYSYIAAYIGYPATTLISSIFLVIIFRIGLAFVFKIFRMNIDYRSLQDKNDRVEKRAKAQHK